MIMSVVSVIAMFTPKLMMTYAITSVLIPDDISIVDRRNIPNDVRIIPAGITRPIGRRFTSSGAAIVPRTPTIVAGSSDNPARIGDNPRTSCKYWETSRYSPPNVIVAMS